MAGGMVLREIFTRLGFETDPMSLKRYEEAIAQTQKTMSALGQSAADVGGRISQAFQQATGLAREGADVQQIATAFEALGGTAEELQKLREQTGGLVSDQALQRAMNLGKLFKLPAQEIPALLKIAQGASVALGTSVEKNIEDVFVAMARQSKLIADNLGTQMGSLDDINKSYAERNKLNAKNLTDEQKAAAFIQTFIEKSNSQAMLAEKAANNQFALLDAQIKNLRDKASLLLNQFFGAVIKDISRLFGPVNKLIAKFDAWWNSAEDMVRVSGLMLDNLGMAGRAFRGEMMISAATAKELGMNTEEVVKGVTNGERVMRRVVMVVRVLAGILATVVAGKIGAGIMGMVQHVWGLVKAIRLATLWTMALKALWAAVPLIIAGIALLIEDALVWLRGGDSLIGRFIKKYEGSNGPAGKIARWLKAFKPTLAKYVATVGAWINKLRGWAAAAVEAVKATIPPVLTAIKSAVAWVKPYAVSVYAWLKEAIPAAIKSVIGAGQTAWEWIKGAVSWLWTAGPEGASALSDGLSWLWGWIKVIAIAIKDAAVVAWEWASRAGRVIADVATKVGAWIWSVLGDLYTAFQPWIYGVAKLVQGVAKVVWGALKGVALGLWYAVQGIWSVLKAVGIFLWENIPPVLNVILQGARLIWHAVLTIIEWIGKAFAALAWVAEWILDKAAFLVEMLLLAVVGFAGAIVKAVGDLVGWIIEKLSPLTAWFFSAIASVVGWVADGVEQFNNGVKAFLAWLNLNLFQPIQGMFSAVGGVVRDVFTEIKSWIQPVIDLIDSTLGKAHDAAVMLGLADEETGPVNYDALRTNKYTAQAFGDLGLPSETGAAIGDAASSWGVQGAMVNAGGITVQIMGNPNGSASEIGASTKQGVEQGAAALGRDLQVGG